MKQRKRQFFKVLLLTIMVFLLAGCRKSTAQQENKTGDKDGGEQYTIGVVVYDPDNAEMNMFMNYYREYLAEGFPVKFYFSGKISSAEEENDFIRTVKKKGAQGIISFYGQDIRSTVEVCQEEELYYVMASGTISDEEFNAVKDNPWFLGTVGPDPASEYRAGNDMAKHFAEGKAKSFLVLTGGSMAGNFMHSSRTQGILEGIAQADGITYTEDVETLVASDTVRKLDTGNPDISITLSPGYLSTENGMDNFRQALAEGTYDAVLCAFNVNDILDQIAEKEEEQNADIQVGTVDSFSEVNYLAFKTKDAFGNSQINYIEGKYASMAGPAFAVLYNAVSGHIEANSESGEAVRLFQGFWTATGEREYGELYGYTQGIYENAYSCDDLMNVIWVFNKDTTPDKLKELTEAYTVEAVKDRILGD